MYPDNQVYKQVWSLHSMFLVKNISARQSNTNYRYNRIYLCRARLSRIPRIYVHFDIKTYLLFLRDCRDRMVVGFTTTYAISIYQYWSFEFESRPCRGVLDTTLCVKACQWLVADRWFSPGIPVSSANKTYRHDILNYCLTWR